ncbi:MAG: carbohydrate kinase family protein [Candidatus Thorarchaeota archaeon]|jgi:sugar/nucleoside kinase (ribokinase family)
MEIVVVGHLSRDLIITPETRREVLGGSTAYAMLAPSIGAFGAGIVSKVGLDFDENYKIDLISSGLNLSGLHYEGAHTTRFINEYDADGERTQRVEDLAHSINPSDFTDAHSEATIIHFSPLSSSEIDKACYDVAREEGALISLDVQGYLRRISDDGLVSPQKWPESDEILGMVDVVKLHDSELRTINLDESELSAVSHILDLGPRIVIITRDYRGSTIYTRNTQVDIPLVLAGAQVDSTGCGDTYAIGFLLEYLRTANVTRAGLFAATCSSFNVETMGPYGMPDRVLIENRMHSYLQA